jgi:DNA polymerase-3 subunit gamma/tau
MSLALYRKYRPSVFADVIGQEHVTVPLSNALESGKTHHAYLFSGPRGCGKTSSARIMARSLNCEKGPTPTPCGTCQSCTDLVANGPGSIDVIELDAATHGLVDDARDLRDKAFFAPVQSKYKIYTEAIYLQKFYPLKNCKKFSPLYLSNYLLYSHQGNYYSIHFTDITLIVWFLR